LPLIALGAAGILFYLLVRDRPEDVGFAPLEDESAPAEVEASNRSAENSTWYERYRAVLGNPAFLLAALVIVFQSFARYGLLTWAATYYSDAGISINDALKLTLSLPIGMGLGAVAGGYFSDRWFLSRRAVVVALFLGISAGCFLVMRANPVIAVGDQRLGIALLFLTGFFVYGAQGPLWAICPDLVGREHSGTAVGIMDALAYGGAAAQGPLLGYIVERQDAGYPALFLTLAGVTATGAILALVSSRPQAAQ
jgi:OPA family glycerol-3-phosphate transporter-like MFS transporter